MLKRAALQSLVLAAVCLSSRAVPLRTVPLRTVPSAEEKCCDGESESSSASPEAEISSSHRSSPTADPFISEITSTPPQERRRGAEHQTQNSRAPEDAEVWTEALHLQREGVSVDPSPPDLLSDVTMSSEDLPLIFEPLEDVTPAGNSALASQMSVAMVPTAVSVEDAGLMVSMDTEHPSSLSALPSSWQMKHDGKTESDDITQMMTVTSSEILQIPTSRSKADTEEQESKEETDEDEEDDGTDSDEDESEEDLIETTMTPPNRPPFSLIPPPPVWMQGNHGLIRSWVELIREKAGYVSGMLAPVGIGIAGALLLVGTLYSIRVIHRRRRENVKHQRSRPLREVRTGPDNAMLLADSSEDEF